MPAATIAMIVLRLRLGLGFWLVDRLARTRAIGLRRRVLTVPFDRAAQEAVDQRGSLLRAAGEDLGKTVRAGFGAALPFPLALLPLGITGGALAGILLAVGLQAHDAGGGHPLEAALPGDGESVRLRTIAGTSPERSPYFDQLKDHPRFQTIMAEFERRRALMAARVEVLLKGYADSGR